MFLNNISYPDYETTKTIWCSSTGCATFKECARSIYARENDLEHITNKECKSEKMKQLLKVRRSNTRCENGNPNSNKKG